MNFWIYAIGKDQYTFVLNNGNIIDGNGKVFTDNIVKDRFPKEGIWWHVKQNYLKVEKNDTVYIYATKSNRIFGIIGIATVSEKRDEPRKEICLKIDKLLDKPILLKDCGIPRKSLHSVSKECKDYITLELEK